MTVHLMARCYHDAYEIVHEACFLDAAGCESDIEHAT